MFPKFWNISQPHALVLFSLKNWQASGDFLTNLYYTASVPYQGRGAAACLGWHGKSEIHQPQRQNRTERWGRREDQLEWVPLEYPPDDTSDATLLWQWRPIACCLWSTDCPAVVSRTFWILQLLRKFSVEVHRDLLHIKSFLTGCVGTFWRILSWRPGYIMTFCLKINKYTGQVSCDLIIKMTQRQQQPPIQGSRRNH